MGCFRFFRIQTGFNIFPNLLGGFDPLGTNSTGELWLRDEYVWFLKITGPGRVSSK